MHTKFKKTISNKRPSIQQLFFIDWIDTQTLF